MDFERIRIYGFVIDYEPIMKIEGMALAVQRS